MGLRNAAPIKFAPVTVCDALDSTDVPSGAMSSLSNLIPENTTRNLFEARPASVEETVFAGFDTPGFISCLKVIGTKAYGLISTARNAGHDEPFAYDLVANTFTTVTGTIDATTTPTSPSDVGVWVPPTMDLVGVNLMVTHPGFSGAGGVYLGWFDLTDPAAPVWHGGNISGGVVFSTPPTAVKNFNGRAYYILNPPTGQPGIVFSDVLDALVVTSGTQILTFDDNVPLTALGGLPLANQLGGIIQSLIVFKGIANVYQVTGDSATSNLAKNSLNIVTGTLAPLTVCPTPMGLAFVSPDGLRIIDFNAVISPPVGFAGTGICAPFTFSVVPSRMVATCGGNVLRISTQNGHALGTPFQEYWYDIARQIWTGPHTFPASMIQPYNNSFVVAPVGVTGKLFMSDVVQSSSSVFTENGNLLSYTWATALLPDTDQMCENAMIETTIYMALDAGGGDVVVRATDQDGTIIDTVTIALAGASTIWGGFQWGQALWGGARSALYPRRVNWSIPIVFRRLSLSAAGTCTTEFKIGRTHMRYEQLGYLQQAS